MNVESQATVCDKIIHAGIIFLLIFAPLAFGSVHVWAYTIIEIGVFFLLALWFTDRLVFSGSGALAWVKTPVNLGLILILVLIILQIVPLPASLVAFISPRTFADKMMLFEMMASAGHATAGSSSWINLSYATHPTIVEWLKPAAYAGMFFLVINNTKSKPRLDRLVTVLIMVGLFEAIYAIFQTFGDTPRVWWWKSRVGTHRWASGTFIVSNHFAAYMEMILPLCFGFFMAQKKQTTRLLSGLGGTRAAMQRIVSWFSPESARPRMFLFFFFAVLMGVSLLFSASRGGILSLGASMLLVSMLFFSKHRYRKYGGLVLGLCMIISVYGLRLGIEPTLNKFKRTKSLSDRLQITRSIIPMIGDYPAVGVGWGNFRYLYPRYILDYDRVSSSGYAHNDWVEAGTETGLAGSILIFAVFSGFMVSMIRPWRQRRDIYAVGIGAGVMAGLLSVAIHSYFDFNMHIPANPLTLAALAGIGYAAVHWQKRGVIESFFYRVQSIQLNRFRRIAMACAVLLLFSVCVSAAGRHFIAESLCPVEWNSTMNLNWDPELADIRRAIAWNPGNAEYHFKLFGYFNRINDPDRFLLNKDPRTIRSSSQKPDTALPEKTNEKELRPAAHGNDTTLKTTGSVKEKSTLSETAFQQAKNERLIRSLERAVRLNPARGVYWYELGRRYSLRKYDPYGYLNRWVPLAEACYDTGLACAPKDADMLFDVAWHWVWRSRLLSEKGNARPPQKGATAGISGNVSREHGIQKFQQFFQRSLSLKPKQWEKAVNRVWEYYPDDGVVLGILPPQDEALKRRTLAFLAKK